MNTSRLASRLAPRINQVSRHLASSTVSAAQATPALSRTMSSSSSASANVPSSMKALRIHKTGGPEVIQLDDDVSVPKPADDEVLMRVEWAGVNFIDTYFRSGLYKAELPFTLGSECSGIVVSTGSAVKDVQEGDRVAGYIGGKGYAQYATVSRAKIHKLPQGVDTKAGSTILLQGLTAWGLLRESYPVQKGEWVLVHAAAGGVGTLLCQLGKHLGARVIGTVSTEDKAKIAHEAGAEQTILYTKEDFAARTLEITDGQGVAAIYDGVGKATWDDDFKCIARKGTIASFGNASGAVPEFALLKLAAKNVKVTRPTLFNTVGTQAEMDRYSTELFDLVAKGVVRPSIFGEYDFTAEGLRKAHADLTGRSTTGKLLVKVA